MAPEVNDLLESGSFLSVVSLHAWQNAAPFHLMHTSVLRVTAAAYLDRWSAACPTTVKEGSGDASRRERERFEEEGCLSIHAHLLKRPCALPAFGRCWMEGSTTAPLWMCEVGRVWVMGVLA